MKAKKKDLNFIALRAADFTTPSSGQSYFDLNLGTTLGVAAGHTSKIENYGNGWYRCSITFTTDAVDTTGTIFTRLSQNGTSSAVDLDNTSNVYTWGWQFEKNSYATSYIKTVGTTQTRVADTASGSGNSTVINSSEGVLYGEFSNTENDTNDNRINLSDGTVNNWVFIGKEGANVRAYLRANNFTVLSNETTPFASINRVALSYKSGDIRLYVNGVQIIAVTDAFSFTVPLNKLNFGDYNGIATSSKASWKSVQVYTTALSDTELTALTTI